MAYYYLGLWNVSQSLISSWVVTVLSNSNTTKVDTQVRKMTTPC